MNNIFVWFCSLLATYWLLLLYLTATIERQKYSTHPKDVRFRLLVAGFLRYEGDGVVESVLEDTGAKARARRDAARNDHAGVEIRRMLEEFAVTGPHGPRQERLIHR